ncbi:gamma-glutamylcyclotransferase [Acuticoccus sediminis]|nr:gamma-glutamylcyclotransferase [Acuticoccus sediminis]
MTDTLRLTRALVDRLPPRTDERGPLMVDAPGPDYYERTAEAVLSRLERPDELWVFAAGSLIWKPRFTVAERRVAHLDGWRRAFCIGDRRFRGCPSAPGLMMSLDRGGSCSGVVLRMAPENLAASLVAMLQTEPPLAPEWVEASTDAGPVRAIAFAIDRSWPLYVPEPLEEDLADILASAVGHVGTMAEYLLNTVTELERHGVRDPQLWRLQSLVAERLERLPVPVEGL